MSKIILILLAPLLLIGCGVENAIRPAEPTGFIERRTTGIISEHTPFDYAWEDTAHPILKKIQDQGYFELYVAPVEIFIRDSDFLHDKSAVDRAKQVAEYLHQRILKEIRDANTKSGKARLVEAPTKDSLTFRLALTEIIVGSPAAYAVGVAIPVPGSANALDAAHSPTMSFIARVADSKTNRSLVEIADRRTSRFRPIDLNKFTKTSPLKDIANDWSKEFAGISQGKLEDSTDAQASEFSLLPW